MIFQFLKIVSKQPTCVLHLQPISDLERIEDKTRTMWRFFSIQYNNYKIHTQSSYAAYQNRAKSIKLTNQPSTIIFPYKFAQQSTISIEHSLILYSFLLKLHINAASSCYTNTSQLRIYLFIWVQTQLI